jgi:hypothetical protein
MIIIVMCALKKQKSIIVMWPTPPNTSFESTQKKLEKKIYCIFLPSGSPNEPTNCAARNFHVLSLLPTLPPMVESIARPVLVCCTPVALDQQ